jgi:plasmid stability protein
LADQNPSWPEERKILETNNLARRKLDQVTRVFDAELSRLGKAVAHLEGELTAPLTMKAAASIAQEIRAHVKAMNTEQRHDFVRAALDSGDEVTFSSACAAPPYLSGLTSDLQQSFSRFWHEKQSPDMAKRLRAMQGAKAMIEQRAGLVFPELTKAVGAPPHKAKRLREANTAAERAFAVQGA